MPKKEGPRSFARFLEQLADGEALSELTKDLFELINTLHDQADKTNGTAKGAMTFKLDIKVDARGVANINYSNTVKEPKPARPGATMWVTPGGNLTAENPRQPNLPLRDVSGNGSARDIDDDRHEARDV